MPYKIIKVRNKDLFKVLDILTNNIYSTFSTREKAKKQKKILSLLEKNKLSGGKMPAKDIKELIAASYDKKEYDIDNYDIDEDLSDERVKVYKNRDNGEIIISHRGSEDARDWIDNAKFLLTGSVKNSKTYKYHKNKQNEIINKYGRNNKITTIGHSRGALYTDELLREGLTDEGIAVNRPLHIRDITNKKPNNLYDVRSKNDPVSLLYGLKRDKKNDIIIPSTTNNILNEHSYNILDRLPENQQIGGRKKILIY
jgi:hypothetical protein